MPHVARRMFLLAAFVLAACLAGLMMVGCSTDAPSAPTAATDASDTAVTADADAILARAFAEQATDLQVQGQGTVTRLLADDNEGGRHQRFIVRLESGQTLLIAHNIDVAPRVASLQVGDAVAFNGVYEWNDQGGIIHWTHLDPQGSHEPGGIEHGGRVYE